MCVCVESLFEAVGEGGVREPHVAMVGRRSPTTDVEPVTREDFSLGLQLYPQNVVRPPWHPPQPPSQEVVGAVGSNQSLIACIQLG